MKDFGCSCKECISYCWRNPGWFGSIDEVIKASKLLGMSIVDFALEYLIQEWWAGEDYITIPAPRRNFQRARENAYKSITWEDEIIRNGKGFKRATWGHNLIIGYACIFLDENEKCRIHNSKPQECRESFGCKDSNVKGREHIKNYWKEHQDFIKLLLHKEENEITPLEDNSELAKSLGWNGLINIGVNNKGNIVKYKKRNNE